MSKKDKIQRNPVPDDPVQGFSMTVYLLAHQLGIDKIPDVFNYVEMLTESCARHVFEQQHKVPPQRKEDKDRKTFIVVFKARYLQLTDFEYDRTVTGVDAKLIKQVNKKLADKSFTIDEYLAWIFDAFLDENPEFCPPSIKWVCSSFVMEKFIYEHRGKIKERHENELHRKEGIAIIIVIITGTMGPDRLSSIFCINLRPCPCKKTLPCSFLSGMFILILL